MQTAVAEKTVRIPVNSESVSGFLAVPEGAESLVIFAHGSGSSRLSVRNRMVAAFLQKSRIGTLLFDLLTPDEDRSYENRFDIGLLADRLVTASLWLKKQPEAKGLSMGYFGASTGAAAALDTAAHHPDLGIGAIVSRGGRPDMAMDSLPQVKAPTLLIVGGLDYSVIPLNEAAYREIGAEKELRIIPGATHLFEEPGTLEEVARLAAEWFAKHLAKSRDPKT